MATDFNYARLEALQRACQVATSQHGPEAYSATNIVDMAEEFRAFLDGPEVVGVSTGDVEFPF